MNTSRGAPTTPGRARSTILQTLRSGFGSSSWIARGLLALALVGCAAASPGSVLGYDTMEQWEADKRERLEQCSRAHDIETREQALRCLGGFKTHRGTLTCTDSAAWVSRVAAGIQSR